MELNYLTLIFKNGESLRIEGRYISHIKINPVLPKNHIHFMATLSPKADEPYEIFGEYVGNVFDRIIVGDISEIILVEQFSEKKHKLVWKDSNSYYNSCQTTLINNDYLYICTSDDENGMSNYFNSLLEKGEVR